MSAGSITDFGLIMREAFPNVRNLCDDVAALRFPPPKVDVIAEIDVPRLGLQLRLLHVHEIPEDGLTFGPLLPR